MGGGDACSRRSSVRASGRSPRGRGRPPTAALVVGALGSIPAWAGETEARADSTTARSVDPRVGGGDTGRALKQPERKGRSPRGRGRLLQRWYRGERTRSIPAWAGETATGPRPAYVPPVDPRVGGGDKPLDRKGRPQDGRSPRGRGRPPPGAPQAWIARSIPAWAGETEEGHARGERDEVDPRVGGGDQHRLDAGPVRLGRSPRGRGRRWGCARRRV